MNNPNAEKLPAWAESLIREREQDPEVLSGKTVFFYQDQYNGGQWYFGLALPRSVKRQVFFSFEPAYELAKLIEEEAEKAFNQERHFGEPWNSRHDFGPFESRDKAKAQAVHVIAQLDSLRNFDERDSVP